MAEENKLGLVVFEEKEGWVFLEEDDKEDEDGYVLVDKLDGCNAYFQVGLQCEFTLVCAVPPSLLSSVMPVLIEHASCAFIAPYDNRTPVEAWVMGEKTMVLFSPEIVIIALPLDVPLKIWQCLLSMGIVPFGISTRDWRRLFMGSDIRLLQALPSLTFDFLGMDARQLLAPFFRAIDVPLPTRSEMFVVSARSVANRALYRILWLTVKALAGTGVLSE